MTYDQLVTKIRDYCEVDSTVFSSTIVNGFIEDVLGLIGESDEKEGKTDQLIKLFLQLRADAKESKDYELSDKIRDQLIKAGVVIKDNKEGTVYSIKE